MLIDNIGQDIAIELISIENNTVNGYLRGYIVGLPFKDGDVLTIKRNEGKYNLVGVNGKEIEIDLEARAGELIDFHYK